ncbi:hypothetical protein [Natrinema halophilum]|uniref:Uncharacterized protein n=1 Tax=Natrinema halophilum TaxID=1699371 RepID=A0A7D5GG02_9EURY|nr:hypothetical protein [Natrinema halophilum]QLG47967.1 hypothetical protein HYG82_03475 [Natrinema halophilum]
MTTIRNEPTVQFAVDAGESRPYPESLTHPVASAAEVQVDDREPKRWSLTPRTIGDVTERGTDSWVESPR